jgi:4-amino-4-deoxy-L-arabinose transferase-like glycosyltransferase
MSSLSFVFLGLLLSAFLSYFSFRSFKKGNVSSIVFWISLSALILRLSISLSDPFLYDWDEKFHALVAKNLIHSPLKPMLFMTPLFPYEVENWCCNHIWTHKPPLFLWLIALSIKTFGVKVISVRIPSILLGTLVVPIIYDISRKWLNDYRVSFIATLLYTFSFYQVELITGRRALDHNDVIFQFFVIASIWGFV